MALLRYEFAWDFARAESATGASVRITDDGGTVEITPFATGTYAHTDLQSVMGTGSYDDFATALKNALDTASSGAGVYSVTWSGTTGYTVAYSNGNFSLTFTTTSVAAQGTYMRKILGMSGNRSGAATYSSQVRPYYVLYPVVSGRSEVSDDYEPDDLVQEAVSDSGTAYDISVLTAPKHIDWMQVGDQDVPSTAYTAFGGGTALHKRISPTATPWTYEHAFEHHRTGFDPILVVDGSESLVCKMRGNKASFHPKRMGAADYDLWSLGFGVRLLGRL